MSLEDAFDRQKRGGQKAGGNEEKSAADRAAAAYKRGAAKRGRAEKEPAEAKPRVHKVVSGDTLSGIAKQYYGSSDKWNDIYQANKEVIGDNPNAIRVGQELTIPDEE